MARQVVRQYKGNDDALAEIAEASWNVRSREHELVGIFILGNMRGLAPFKRWDYGTRFLPQVTNWESCDQLCAALLGHALAEDPGFMDSLEGWVENENFWFRRAALVATVYVRRARYDDEIVKALDTRTLSMCEILLDDDEKYIHKAVDWAVREVIKRHYNLAFAWMLARAESGPSSTARSILNLAAKKLEEEDRTRLLEILYRD
jgi:3-methyladenine DNA glycosylase AlkD